MRAELRFLFSPDADPLSEYRPEGDFGILVQAMIGPAGGKGHESFDFVLCTIAWFEREHLQIAAPVSGRHFLFVRVFDYATLEKFVGDYSAACEGATWDEVADKLSRLGHWEFEDYRPYVP